MSDTFQAAQDKELEFWHRWCQHVRDNYDTPADYVRERLADTLIVRGMTADDFKDKSVIEYGPGMYPMVSVLPVKSSRLIEPLYSVFSNLMIESELELWRKSVVALSPSRGEFYRYKKRFNYCLLKNMLDHTTDPAALVANINADVVLVDSFVGRDEDPVLHPSAFKTVDEIKALFANDYRLTFEAVNQVLMCHYLTFERTK